MSLVEDKSCGKTEEHMFHSYDATVDVVCEGKTDCGAWGHRPHTFQRLQHFWCHGVCNCGMLSRGPHGPGAHK